MFLPLGQQRILTLKQTMDILLIYGMLFGILRWNTALVAAGKVKYIFYIPFRREQYQNISFRRSLCSFVKFFFSYLRIAVQCSACTVYTVQKIRRLFRCSLCLLRGKRTMYSTSQLGVNMKSSKNILKYLDK